MSPVNLNFSPPPLVIFLERNVILGYFSASKKSAECRCASRFGSWVLTLAVSTQPSMTDCSGCSSFNVSVPSNVVNCPRTVEIIMCFTEKPISEWAGSIFQDMGRFSSQDECVQYHA